MLPSPAPKALILDCEGPVLTPEERSLFREHRPFGFILFQRHCQEPDQVRRLVSDLRDAAGWGNGNIQPLILIDQEGGRVARLKPPYWRAAPPAGTFATFAGQDIAAAERAVFINARLMAEELRALGITVNCVPMADVLADDAHAIMGDRTFGKDPAVVARLAAAQARGMMEGGVLPVLKHLPGHGRARADSHTELPVVDAQLDVLERTDFPPFKALKDLPLGMTAHILYPALDAEHVSTQSPKVIRFIRESLGFDGLLMSDDLSMKALKGAPVANGIAALEAGCDLALLCNASFDDRHALAEAVPSLAGEALRRANAAFACLSQPHPFAVSEATAELERLLA